MGIMDSIIPASGVTVQQPYQLGHQYGADTGAYRGTQNLGQYNLGGQNLGQYAGLTQAGVYDPNAAGYQQGAGTAGGMLEAAGQGAYGQGAQMIGANQALLPDVQTLIQMGFDPQQALYQRTQQEVAQQQAAQAQQSGIGGTPYGQGLADLSNRNFNIDWQNQQLNRALAGAQGAGGLLGQIGQGVQQGQGMQYAGGQEYMQGAALPWQTSQGINAAQRGILGQAAAYGQQAAAIPQMQIQDYLSYLSQANQNAQTQQQATRNQLAQAQMEFNQAQAVGQDIGSIAAFGATGAPGTFGGYGNPFAGQFGGGGMVPPTAYAGMNQVGLPGNAIA